MSSTQYTIPGMHIVDHVVTVPLNWNNPDDARSITIFAREVVDPRKKNDQLPLLVFLQGGPGGKSPRPMPGEGWIASVLDTHRVVLVDQRGTGRSTRVQSDTIARFDSTLDARDYLLCFRADSIVADLEYIRTRLYNGVKWESLGQSYGGFITLSYLSLAPAGLSACYVAGGLTSVMPSADEVYRRTYPRVAEKTRRFYERYPLERERVGAVADLVAEGDVVLPDGDLLSVRRLQTLGLDLGMGPGFDRVHWLFDDAFADEPRREGTLSDSFLAQVAAKTSYDDNPLFAVMQESIYGSGAGATQWAADRIGRQYQEFSTNERPLLFTGEMMYPWMFDQIRSLRPFKAVAEALAEFEDYTVLYDLERLAANEVPVASVSYFDDMYVDVGFSNETKDLVGNLQFWVTNEYEHDGIRQDVQVTKRLISLVSEMGGPLT
ncbi:MAG: alpha/beta fold hydrolase [Leifsonia sp.]